MSFSLTLRISIDRGAYEGLEKALRERDFLPFSLREQESGDEGKKAIIALYVDTLVVCP
jgi:hypothetical protein